MANIDKQNVWEYKNIKRKTCSSHLRHCHHFDQKVIHRADHKKVGKIHGDHHAEQFLPGTAQRW